MINIILADANRLLREGLRRIIGDDKLDIIGEFVSVSEAAAGLQLPEANPKLLICDPSADSVAEFAAIRSLRERFSELRVILLTDAVSPRLLRMALDLGADGYLPKNISPQALRYAIEIILLDEEIFPTLVSLICDCTSKIVSVEARRPETPLVLLSLRESQILRCLTNGTSNKGIARELNMAEATVKVHLKSLLRKLNASNRTQAAIRGVNNPALLELQMNGSGRPAEQKALQDLSVHAP